MTEEIPHICSECEREESFSHHALAVMESMDCPFCGQGEFLEIEEDKYEPGDSL